MKNILVVVSLLCASFISTSQEIDQQKFKNEIGIEATSFIKQYLNFATSEYYMYIPNTYLLSYKRISNNQALRIGFNGFYEVKKDTGGYNTNTGYTDKNKYFDLRLGYELRNQIGKRWLWYYGIDLLGGYTHRIQHNMSTSYGTPDWIHNIKRIGGGPIIGFQFLLTKRLSISTEGSLYLLYSKDDVEFKYVDVPEQNRKELHESTHIQFSPPFYVSFNLSL